MWKRSLKVIAVVIGLIGLFAAFQNCSSAMQFTASGEVGEASNYQAPVTRSLTLSPITHKIENEEPIKFLFVVDDSGTMKNSQENLARSIASLGELLKDYNAEVMVVSTTCSDCVVVTQNEVSTENGLTTKILKRDLNPQLRKFSISKHSTLVEKERVLTELSDFILNLGTRGAVTETPLRSIAWVLDSQNFFNRGDNAIIYVLTDEDDSESAQVSSRQYLKYEKIVKTETQTVIIPAGNVPGYTWTRQYYSGTFQIAYYDQRCSPPDDMGNRECDEGEERWRTVTNSYPTLSECETAVSGQKSAKCTRKTNTSERPLDSNETVSSKCAYYREKYGSQVTKCEAKTVRVDADEETIGGELVSEEVEYFLDLNPNELKLQKAIGLRLEEMFSGNYVLAAQVNVQGQNCTLGQGQSIDRAFSEFSTILPEGRFYRSSICEESALNGDALREIAVQLTVNITNNYMLDLENSERILGLYVVIQGQKRRLMEGSDFSFSNDVLTLIRLKPTEIESMIVDVGQKENWKYQEGQ